MMFGPIPTILFDLHKRLGMDRYYRSRDLPWGGPMENKVRFMIDMLGERRYADALDIGCGIGDFTAALAAVAGHVVGSDISSVAIAKAREKHGGSGVRFRRMNMQDEHGSYDLVCLNDVLYYLGDRILGNGFDKRLERIDRLLRRDSDLLITNVLMPDRNAEYQARCYFKWFRDAGYALERRGIYAENGTKWLCVLLRKTR